VEASHYRKEMMLYAETPEIIPFTPAEPIILPVSTSPAAPETPSPVKRRTHRLFFNFNKSKSKTLSPASEGVTPKKCIKPTLYTLSE
jgi:hypothetical protein